MKLKKTKCLKMKLKKPKYSNDVRKVVLYAGEGCVIGSGCPQVGYGCDIGASCSVGSVC